jgi:hypothetical protein
MLTRTESISCGLTRAGKVTFFAERNVYTRHSNALGFWWCLNGTRVKYVPEEIYFMFEEHDRAKKGPVVFQRPRQLAILVACETDPREPFERAVKDVYGAFRKKSCAWQVHFERADALLEKLFRAGYALRRA